MIYEKEIEGIFTRLRYAKEEDSEFILSLRLDPTINKFLNKTDPDIKKQRQWIKSQQIREHDYYFIIMDKKNIPKGTIGLYKISLKKKEGEFGRWISTGSAINSIESVILLHDFGFNTLGLRRIFSQTTRENRKVLSFHKRFGAKAVRENLGDHNNEMTFVECEIDTEDFRIIKEINLNLLKNMNGLK